MQASLERVENIFPFYEIWNGPARSEASSSRASSVSDDSTGAAGNDSEDEEDLMLIDGNFLTRRVHWYVTPRTRTSFIRIFLEE